MVLVPLIGIASALFIAALFLEWSPMLPAGRGAGILATAARRAEDAPLPAWRRSLRPLEAPAARWSPAGYRRRVQGDLYFAGLAGRWGGWTDAQFIALQVAAAAAGLLVGLILLHDGPLTAVAVVIGWQAPASRLSSVARRTRRRFESELPEFVQLVAAQMAAGVSLEQAFGRTSRAQGLVAEWIRRVLQAAQGRDFIAQLQAEASASRLPALITMAVQLEFIRRGTAQQELMGLLVSGMASEYAAAADIRAERIGSELIIPVGLFDFAPFIVVILMILGWQALTMFSS